MSAITEANAIQRKLDTADRQHMTALAREKERHEKRLEQIKNEWLDKRAAVLGVATPAALDIIEIDAKAAEEPTPDAA